MLLKFNLEIYLSLNTFKLKKRKVYSSALTLSSGPVALGEAWATEGTASELAFQLYPHEGCGPPFYILKKEKN